MVKFWHGAKKWSGWPELRTSKPQRAECGPGFYMTTSYERASQYAKGGGSKNLIELKDDLVFADEVEIDLKEVFEFIEKIKILKNREKIIEDIKRNASKKEKSSVKANVIINLFVNYGVSHGKVGVELALFLKKNGISAAREKQSGGEEWIVLFDMSKVVNVKKIQAKDLKDEDRYLGQYVDQIRNCRFEL